MSKTDLPATDEVVADDLQWRLSQVNPNRPLRVTHVPEDLRTTSLLAQDVIELEAAIAEWEAIAAQYRELAQIAIDRVAEQDKTVRRLTERLRELMQA